MCVCVCGSLPLPASLLSLKKVHCTFLGFLFVGFAFFCFVFFAALSHFPVLTSSIHISFSLSFFCYALPHAHFFPSMCVCLCVHIWVKIYNLKCCVVFLVTCSSLLLILASLCTASVSESVCACACAKQVAKCKAKQENDKSQAEKKTTTTKPGPISS